MRESVYKKITAAGAAFFFLMCLTACGSNGTSDKTDLPETYEDYIELANTYLQMDDVTSALAVLDEGMERLSVGETGIELQEVDLLSQRKEYILVCTAAVRTKLTERYRDGEDMRDSRIVECDDNGNEVYNVCYTESGIDNVTECRYDDDGNQIEYQYQRYDEEGSIVFFTRTTYAYDADGREIEYVSYDKNGEIRGKAQREYDENGNKIKTITYGSGGEKTGWMEWKYNAAGYPIEDTVYNADGICTYKRCREYDARENLLKDVITNYDKETGQQLSQSIDEYEYDENGNRIEDDSHIDFTDFAGYIHYDVQQEYDEQGKLLKKISTYSDGKTGQQTSQYISEYGYDEKGNMAKYDRVVYGEEIHGHSWEREYNENGKETAFSYEDDAAFYESKTEYDENGLPVSYTGVDANEDILVHKETEYNASGKVIKESYYDADETLIRYYENEYDDFGSITRQAMYEDGILKSEKQLSYTYHYIGDIDAQTMDNQNYDTYSDEYRQRQREILDRFLKGEGKVRYCDGVIVNAAVTDLVDFAYAKESENFPKYIYMDMTGDGIEELLIWEYYGDNFYVIQCEYGILKVIGRFKEHEIAPVMWNGRGMTIDCTYGDTNLDIGFSETNYFFDGQGKNEVCIRTAYQESEEGEAEEMHYWIKDNDSFEEREMSKGEYYDITDQMITWVNIEIDWKKLEAPVYGND